MGWERSDRPIAHRDCDAGVKRFYTAVRAKVLGRRRGVRVRRVAVKEECTAMFERI